MTNIHSHSWMLQFLYRQFTIALHALVGEPVQDGAAVVTDGAAGSEVVFHPGVGGPVDGLGNNKLLNYRQTLSSNSQLSLLCNPIRGNNLS